MFRLETGYRAECRKEVKIASRSLIETEKTDINDLLAKAFILMCQACAAMHQQRLKEEEEARLRAAKLREARDEVEKYNNEIKRLNSALEEAKRYKEATLLREYAEALSKEKGESQFEADCLHAKADWLDPLVSASDSILGNLSPDDYPPRVKPFPNERDLFANPY